MHCEQVMHALNSMVNNMYSALLKRIYCELFTGIHLHLKELNKLKCLQTFYWKKTPKSAGKKHGTIALSLQKKKSCISYLHSITGLDLRGRTCAHLQMCLL